MQISHFSLQSPAWRPQISTHSFLDSRFRFQFLPPGWNFGPRTFLISRFSIQTRGRSQPGDYKILVSDFKIQNSGFKEAHADPKTSGSSFHISCFRFQSRPRFMVSKASTYFNSYLSFLGAQTTECKELSVYTIQNFAYQLTNGILNIPLKTYSYSAVSLLGVC